MNTVMRSEFIDLTELWQDQQFLKVGEIIDSESWSAAEIAEFCAYFCKYLGTTQLDILYKFLKN